MSRHIKEIGDHISIAYGYDRPIPGYFLQIYDDRLQWEENKSNEENEEAEAIDPSGDGCIDSFATNEMLICKHVVGKNRILELLEEYNVNADHCMNVVLDQPIE